MPISTLNEFKALNLISPFTGDAQAYREGLIATLLYNKGCTKSSQTKSVTDLFPYLSNETPDFLEDEKVIKAKQILRTIGLQKENEELFNASMEEFTDKMREEIDLQKQAKQPDWYVIRELQKLIGDDNGKDL